MTSFVELISINALSAGVLALAVAGVGRHVRPAISHGLWVLVLLRLLMVPVLPLPVVPRAWLPDVGAIASVPPAPIPASHSWPVTGVAPAALSAARTQTPPVIGAPPLRALSEPRKEPFATTLGQVIAGGLVLGASLVALLALTRSRRFARLAARARPAPPGVRAEAEQLAGALGVRRAPPVWVVDAVIPPLLWPTRGELRILIPQELLAELSFDELRTLLAHELAHVRRGDHRLRALELAVSVLFWWYPVAWWARRHLRQAEERCCDEWVARTLPASGRAYAETLLKTATFLSRQPAGLPLAATGMSPARDLEQRLKEILMTRPTPEITRPLRVALVLAALTGLAVFPTWATQASEDRTDTTSERSAKKPAPEVPEAPVPPPPPPVPALAPVAPRAPLAPLPVRPSLATTAPLMARDPVIAGVLADDAAPDESRDAEYTARRRDLEKRSLALQREQLALDLQARKLQQQEIALARQSMEEEGALRAAELRQQAARKKAEGDVRQAEAYEASVARLQEHLALELERLSLEARQTDELGSLENALALEELETSLLDIDERHDEAEARRDGLEARRHEMEKQRLDFERQSHALERRAQQAELAMRRTEEALQAAERNTEMQHAQAAMRQEAAWRDAESALRAQELDAREGELKALEAARRAERLEAAGQAEQATAAREAATEALAAAETSRRDVERAARSLESEQMRHELEAHIEELEAARRAGRSEDVEAIESRIAELRAALDGRQSGGER